MSSGSTRRPKQLIKADRSAEDHVHKSFRHFDGEVRRAGVFHDELDGWRFRVYPATERRKRLGPLYTSRRSARAGRGKCLYSKLYTKGGHTAQADLSRPPEALNIDDAECAGRAFRDPKSAYIARCT
jgi:hypothetical protein